MSYGVYSASPKHRSRNLLIPVGLLSTDSRPCTERMLLRLKWNINGLTAFCCFLKWDPACMVFLLVLLLKGSHFRFSWRESRELIADLI